MRGERNGQAARTGLGLAALSGLALALAGCGTSSNSKLFSTSALDLFSTSSTATKTNTAPGGETTEANTDIECPERQRAHRRRDVGDRQQSEGIRTLRPRCALSGHDHPHRARMPRECRHHDHEGRHRRPHHHRSGRRSRHGRCAAAHRGGAGWHRPEDHRVEIRPRNSDGRQRGGSRRLHPYRSGYFVPAAAAARRISTPMWSMSASIRSARSRKRRNPRSSASGWSSRRRPPSRGSGTTLVPAERERNERRAQPHTRLSSPAKAEDRYFVSSR